MELTQKDIKFLTIMNETRLSDGKMFGRYSDEVKGVFDFSDGELGASVKKLVKMGMLSVMEISSNEKIYFYTDKVSKEKLDRNLREIRH